MHRIAACVTVIAALSASLGPGAHATEQDKGYIYDGTGEWHNVAIVIDVKRTWVDMQGKEGARIGSEDGNSGGYYYSCGNKAFYCMTGALEIVIPKAMPMKQWAYHGLSCQSVAQAEGDTYRITCRSTKFLGRPTYTYSLSRGVVSIESSPVAGGFRYELRGDRGLFSSGNDP